MMNFFCPGVGSLESLYPSDFFGRKSTCGRECRVRRFVVRVLEQNKPANGSPKHLAD